MTLIVIADVVAVVALLGAPLSPPVALHPWQSKEHDARNEDHRTREVKPAVVVADGVIQRTCIVQEVRKWKVTNVGGVRDFQVRKA